MMNLARHFSAGLNSSRPYGTQKACGIRRLADHFFGIDVAVIIHACRRDAGAPRS
jgi:hypothetical protein